MNRMRPLRNIVLLPLLAYAMSCGGASEPSGPTSPGNFGDLSSGGEGSEAHGLDLRLRDGSKDPGEGMAPGARRVEASKLSDAEAQKLLSRLPGL
ncbi:MAG: hypothetical protein KC417_14090, partial [Myxococcales bacterium]|nr:hypothetical protein [Myxococcales bacterium]